MRRREFITLIGGAAAWPLAVRAQQAERMRRVGVLEGLPDDAYLAAFLQGMQQLGWADGHNVRIDTRWGAGNVDDIRKYAAELSALAPHSLAAQAVEAPLPPGPRSRGSATRSAHRRIRAHHDVWSVCTC